MQERTIQARIQSYLRFSGPMRVAVYCRVGTAEQASQIQPWHDKLHQPTCQRMGEIDYLMLKLLRRSAAKKGW